MTKLLAQVCLASSLFVVAACHREPADPRAVNKTTVPVHARTVSESLTPVLYDAAGTVRAKVTSALSTKIMGTVVSVTVHAGDKVGAGQVLLVLDSKDLDAQFESAQAAEQGARSSLAEAESAISSARSNADLAEVTFQRMKTLYDQRSISNQEFDEATAKVKTARASYEMAMAKRQQAESAIAQSNAGLRVAGVNKGYSRIVAPFAGVITDKNVEPGTLAVPGTPLLSIERLGSYRFEAAVEESHLSSIHLKQKVEVDIDGLTEPLTGVVSEVAPTVDPSSRTYIVKMDLQNKSSLRSGLFGRAQFATGDTKAIMIPADAVRTNGQLDSALVNESGVARIRILTTGQKLGGRVTVLSGLEAGDQLIYPVPPGLADGSPVEVRQ
jgi:RND family efflux transporter MFP subunit